MSDDAELLRQTRSRLSGVLMELAAAHQRIDELLEERAAYREYLGSARAETTMTYTAADLMAALRAIAELAKSDKASTVYIAELARAAIARAEKP